MLNIQEVADLLNNKFDNCELAKQLRYTFKIRPELAKYEGGSINGILLTTSADPEPLENASYVQYSYSLQFVVGALMSNEHVLNVEKIIDEIIKQLNGTEQQFSSGKGIVLLTGAVPQEYDTRASVGQSLPVGLTIKVNYAEDELLSTSKKWLLDDVEIPFLSESLMIDKEGEIHKVNGRLYTQTLITGQTKYYNFEIPFNTKSPVCVMLQKDMLQGRLDKTYKLTYYDGTTFTKDEPFETRVSIFKSGNSKSSKPKPSNLNITFSDADDGKNETKYYIALLNWEFGTKGENTRYFKNKQEQQSEFNNILNSGPYEANFQEIKAPNLESLYITSQVYRNSSKLDVMTLVNKNYAIIKAVSPNVGTKYYYYYVNNARIGAGQQVYYDLELDTIQTYFISGMVNLSNCFIKRAHLNRWVEGDIDSDARFNGKINSELFEREEVQEFSKRLKSRKRISLNTYFNESEVNKWLDDNIQCWMYLFLDPKNKYKLSTGGDKDNQTLVDELLLPSDFYDDTSMSTQILPFELKDIETGYNNCLDSGFIACCVPIYKTGKRIFIKENKENDFKKIMLDPQGVTCFEHENNDASFVFGKKLSALPPFGRNTSLTTSYRYQIDEKGNLILEASLGAASEYKGKIRFINGNAVSSFYNYPTGYFLGIYAVEIQTPSVLTKEIELDAKFEFTKHNLTRNWERETEFNPKLLSADYREIRISDQTGNGFIYDLQKLNKNNIQLLYTEPLTPDVTKSYIRIYNPDGVYINETAENYTGFVGSNDLSLTLSTDKFQQMLADNKNYFMQTTLNAVATGAGVALGGAVGAASTGTGEGVASAGSSFGFGLMGAGFSLINASKTMDNMRSAPSNIQKATGSAALNMMVSPFGVYIEDYEILPNEKEMVNDYMYKYGYAFNKIGAINDYLNTRKFFNYIQAQVEGIELQDDIGMSIVARDNLIMRFDNGIRFWNKPQDSKWINYRYENYETWLEE